MLYCLNEPLALGKRQGFDFGMVCAKRHLQNILNAETHSPRFALHGLPGFCFSGGCLEGGCEGQAVNPCLEVINADQ